jgi:hypothetical protein
VKLHLVKKEGSNMTAKELLEIAYVVKHWNVKMSEKEVCDLIDQARKYSAKCDLIGLK